MIILHSCKSTILRVPKTGSTSLESSIRMCPNCLQAGDFATGVDDANLGEVGSTERFDAIRLDYRNLRRGIQAARALAEENGTEPIYTSEEQSLIDDRLADLSADTFTHSPLSHGVLDDLVNPDTYGAAGLITHEQVLSYNHYAFIRNPLNRVISGFLFKRAMGNTRRVPVTIGQFHDVVLNGEMTRMVYRQQSDYFKYKGNLIVTPLVFENFVPQLNQLITTLGGIPLNEYPNFKSKNLEQLSISGPTPNVENWITPFPNIKQAIVDRYHEDVTIWENASGETL